MRAYPPAELESFRRDHPQCGSSPFGEMFGWFVIPVLDGELRILSGGFGDAWEHVSVSHPFRCPTWGEMCRVKDLFWSGGETVLQFHPMQSEYVNTCENCLHLWKQAKVNHPLPPRELI